MTNCAREGGGTAWRTPLNPAKLVGPVGVLLVAAIFTGYCLVDLARAEQVRYLPRGAWAIVCVATMPFGGMLYLMYGKVR
jgi:hypothetical protein